MTLCVSETPSFFPQDGGVLSWGRPTYGRLGRQAVDVKTDSALPEPLPVDGLEGVQVLAASAGTLPAAAPPPSTPTHTHTPHSHFFLHVSLLFTCARPQADCFES